MEKLWLYTASLTDGVITDACKGDSGGPLIFEKGGQPLLIGILEVSMNVSHKLCLKCTYSSRVKVTTVAQTHPAGTEAGAMWYLRGTGSLVTYQEVFQVGCEYSRMLFSYISFRAGEPRR